MIEGRIDSVRTLLEAGDETINDLLKNLDELLSLTGATADRLGIVGARSSERLVSARYSAELIDDPEQLSSRTTWNEDLAVIEWALRPAVPVEKGRAVLPGGRWNDLANEDLSGIERAVCRLDLVTADGGRMQAGSGVFVATKGGDPGVATAAHVVKAVRAHGWEDGQGEVVAVGVDLHADEPKSLSVTSVVEMDPDRDLAVLRCAGDPPPDALEFAPAPAEGDEVAVFGFPFFDSRRDAWAHDFGFREPTGVLRVSPGVSLGPGTYQWRSATVEAFSHDASTLSGSSGSAVLELSGWRLVGLHVGGHPLRSSRFNRFEWNLAIPVAPRPG